jgi:hypothetical protein
MGKIRSWSGIRESNPRLDLGKVAYYHYTNPALGFTSRQAFIYSMAPEPGQDPASIPFHRGVLGRNSARLQTHSHAATNSAARPWPANLRSSRLPGCAWTSPQGISSAYRQISWRARGLYTPGQTFHRRRSTRSLASDGASGACRAACGWFSLAFSFSLWMDPSGSVTMSILEVSRK